MKSRAPSWLPLCIAMLAIFGDQHAFAAASSVQATDCRPCELTNPKQCQQQYDDFFKSQKLESKTSRMEALQNVLRSVSCAACIPAELTLMLLDVDKYSDEKEVHTILCSKAAKQTVDRCEHDYPNVFSKMPKHEEGLRKLRGNDPDSCTPETVATPPARPISPTSKPAQPASTSRTLGSKLMLGFGVPVTALGVSLLIATVAKATALAAPVKSATGCGYQGFDSPCFDPLPATLLGISGSIVTLGGIGLIVGGAYKPAAKSGPSAISVPQGNP